ncbi:hypothetical protein [Methylomonas sp. AM2-LC]|uniref:hypothetical protein n=1 Tax=Methylomonas sp. AM2-LC TaxID=3153301 RepID=UPI0032637AAA
MGFFNGLGSVFFTSLGGTGVGGVMGWFTAGEGGADNIMSIIGNGTAAENGSGAGRLTYQNKRQPCNKAAARVAENMANGRRYLAEPGAAIKGKPPSLGVLKAEGKNSDILGNWMIALNMCR